MIDCNPKKFFTFFSPCLADWLTPPISQIFFHSIEFFLGVGVIDDAVAVGGHFPIDKRPIPVKEYPMKTTLKVLE